MTTHRSRIRRHSRFISEVTLSVGAVAGLVCIVAAILALALGIRPMIVRSGSMEPAMPIGSLVLTKEVDADALDPGDIVSVKGADGSLLTHRLVAIDSIEQGTATFRMKGDANASEDLEPYVTTAADRVFFTIPAAGYVASWLGTPPAWGLIALTSAGLLYLAFRPRPHGDYPEPRRRGLHATATGSAGTAAASMVIAATVVTAGFQIGTTRAVFADTATTTSTFSTAPFGSFSVVPSALNCIDDQPAPRTARLYWAPAPSGYSYRVEIFDGAVLVGLPHRVPEGTSSYIPTAGAAPAPDTGTRTYTARLHTVYTPTGSTSVAYSTHDFTSTFANFFQTPIHCASGQTAAPMAAPATTSTSTTAPAETTTTAPTTTLPPSTTTAPATSTTTTTASPPATTTTTSPPATTTTTPPPTTALPAGGVTSPSGAYTAYADGSGLTIRDSAAAVVYTDTIVPGSNLHWQSGTDTLWVIHDGQADKVSQSGGVWSTTAVPNADLPPEIAALI